MQQAIASGTVVAKRYQIQKKIPDTTSNYCYLAEDTDQSNRLVVISFPRMELQTLPGFAATFDDACQRLMKARLNGLIKILDHGEHDSQPFAVLQYVTHDTLESSFNANQADSKKTSVDEVLDWARPLAVTLDELHELDYVHSNVRPSTIFLGQKRQVLLGDFITEFAIQRLGAFKQAISSLDIADHLAPEYIKSNYNESYDQYLLATIVYEALAGRSHFHNPGSSEAYRRQVATKFPEPLLTHRPELVGASRILGKALERNPVKRFENCREFVNQLGSAQINPVFGAGSDKPVTVIKKVLDLDETVPAEPIITSIRSNRQAGRKKGFIWLGLLLLSIGAGAYAISYFDGVDQLKDKLKTSWANLSSSRADPQVVVPATTLTTTESAPVATPSDVVPLGKVESIDTSDTPQSSDEGQPKAAQRNIVSNDALTSPVLDAPIANIPVLKNSTVATVQTDRLSASDDTVSQTDAANVDSATDLPTASVTDADLQSAVTQALTEGQAEFVQQRSEIAKDEVTTEAAINNAISLALQEAQFDFMRQTSPAGAEENGTTAAPDGSENENLSPSDLTVNTTEQLPDAETANAETPAVDADTLENKPLSDEEIEAQDLNAQMLEASRLADERAAAAEARKQARQAKIEADKQALEEAKNKAAEEAAAQNEADPVVRAPAQKSFEEMQKERARFQAIKAQKIARIRRITEDCVTSGKIHRQVVAGNLPYVKNCLSVGVNPNLTQSNRWSLLHLAALGGYLNMAKLLVAKGADVNAKAADGKTPLDMATDQKQERLINYLRSRGGVTTR